MHKEHIQMRGRTLVLILTTIFECALFFVFLDVPCSLFFGCSLLFDEQFLSGDLEKNKVLDLYIVFV